ncbi:MAG TPA: DMT family transporter, partial [Burkholderiaceae bacterium]|nr:DMT family transporter [Burkholderiaceae bacterium]
LAGQAGEQAGSARWQLGVVLSLVAAAAFAAGTVAWRKPMPLPPLVSVAWQVGLGCLPMVVIGLVFEEPDLGALSARGWAAMVYMAAVPMALCYLAWFTALRHVPPTTASMATLLIPIIGIGSASIALGEPLGFRELVALILTLAGVALALRES